MTFVLLAEQILNGVQFGIMLFLMAAGLTLIFGVMGVGVKKTLCVESREMLVHITNV